MQTGSARPPAAWLRRALSFRAKLLATYLLLVAVVELGTLLALDWRLSSDLLGQLDARLLAQARGAVQWFRQGGRHPDKLAPRMAQIVGGRVTIFGRDGTVLGDSGRVQVTGRRVRWDEAPELRAVQAGRIGKVTRHVTALDTTLRYVAVPAPGGAILRLGMPVAQIEATRRHLRLQLLLAGALGLGIALGLAWFIARATARPLKAMTRAATALADGRYDSPLPTHAPDEFGTLARALRSLATQLQRSIGTLTEERDRLSAMLGSMVEGVMVLDGEARVRIANPSAVQLLGTGGASVGQPFQPTAQWAALQQWVAQCRQMPSSAHARAELVRNEAGDRSLVVSVQHLGQGRGDETVVVLHDVTQLERLQGFRRDFVADVSHELRTPVAAIRGFAETLLRGRPDAATAREFIDIIHRHAERIGRLVDDLLQLSGLQAQGGRAPQVHAPMPLLPLAERVCASVIRRPDSKHGRVHIDIAPELSLAVDADSLEQVLDNLLTNALRYGLDEGQVWLSACLEDAQVQIEVRDDGPGIAAEHLPRLTERFYRVDAGRSRAQGGTGLGLAIVKELVELLGGSLCITSTVGRGTTCRVTLPGGGAAAQSPTGVQA